MGSRHGEVEHLGILEAIEDRDPRELDRRLIAHMVSGYDMVIHHLAQHPELLESELGGNGGGNR